MSRAISTRSMSHEAWLASRRKGIGGSDVAAILNLNPYKSPLDVYQEKTGQKGPEPENARMKAGKKLEDTIADWWAEDNGFKIQRDNKIRIHPKHDVLIANIDRLILSNGHGLGTGVLEAKNTNSYAFKKWEDEGLPFTHYSQIQHYFSVTGHQYGYVAVLVDGHELLSIPVEYDKEYIANMTEQLLDFWHHHVLANVPPAPRDEADVKALYPRVDNEKELDVTNDQKTLVDIYELAEVRRRIKELDAVKADLETKIKVLMKDHTVLTANGERLVTWKQSRDAVFFDTARLQKENPDLYQSYTGTRPGSRRFLLKSS